MTTRSAMANDALAAWQAGELAQAEGFLRRALALPLAGSAVTDADLLLQLAGVLATAQRHDEAISVYERAVAVAVSAGASVAELDVARYLRAEHLLSLGRHHDVVTVTGEVTRESSMHAPARVLEAVALAELGLPGALEAASEAVSAARTNGQRERIVALLLKSTPPSDELTRSLFEAARTGNVQVAARALAGGADVRSRDTALGADAETPLVAAAGNGHDAVVTLLLSRGAEVDARTTSGWTALMRACNGGYIQCVKLLLDSGADPSLRNEEGYTAFGRIPGNLPNLLDLVASRGGQP